MNFSIKILSISAVALFLLSISPLANAQIGPEQLISRTPFIPPYIMHSADLDGDNREDLIAAGNSGLVWYQNSGSEFFVPFDTIAIGIWGISEIRTGDFDGDNDQDILCSYFNSACATGGILEEENPLVLSGMIPPAPPPPMQGYVTWFENINNSSDWIVHSVDDTLAYAYTVDYGDLDGDGDIDFLAGTSKSFQCDQIEGSATWYENLGGGVYGGRQYLVPLTDSLNATAVRTADIDGDDDLDVVIARNKNNLLVVLENLGGAVFNQYVLDSLVLYNPLDLEFADMDGDSFEELVYMTYDGIGWLDSTGGILINPINLILDSMSNLETLHIRDVDGDDDLDVLTCSSFDQKVLLFENDGSGTIWNEVVIDTMPESINQVHTIDVNEDGNFEVLELRYGWPRYEITWRKNIDNQFDEIHWITPDFTYGTSIIGADLDDDNDVDLLVSSHHDDKLTLYENMGGGVFMDPQQIALGIDGASDLSLADIDQDGKMDIVSSGRNSDRIYWQRNLGAGDYADTVLVTTTATDVYSFVAEDINGDDYPDIVASCAQGDKVTWYPNLGDGSFGPEVVISNTVDGPGEVVAADLDGDNDLDVVVALNADDKLVWYKNNGGIFSAEISLSNIMLNPLHLVVSDIDLDNDLDILCGDSYGIHWFENLNDTAFVDQIIVDIGFPRDIQLSDLNGNGVSEILSGFSSGGTHGTFMLVDNGAQVYDSLYQIIAKTPNQIITADLDGDSDDDVVLLYSSELAWFENLHLLTSEGGIESDEPFVNVFPNPTTGRSVIQNSEKMQLTVTDATGKAILKKTCNSLAQIDLSDQPDGVYFLNFESATGTIKHKLIKMK